MDDNKRKVSDAAADAAASIAKKMVARPLTPDEAIAVVDGKAIAAKIIGIAPEELQALAYGGFQMIEAGRFKDAEQMFLGLVTLDRGEPIFHNALGIAYLRQEKLIDARRAFTDAIKLDPKNPHFYLNLGEVLSQQGLLQDAVIALAQVEPNTPAERRDTDAAVARARTILAAMENYLRETLSKAPADGGKKPKSAPTKNKTGSKAGGTKKKTKK